MSKSLIIVESPAKARTLQRYLGKSFTVKASVGHIRDLPEKTLGVDVEHDFQPKYVTIRGKSKIISELKSAAQKADEIFLAPDPDREGEAIAWHIATTIDAADKPVKRVLFHELTKKAILAAIENATEIDLNKFEAQQARRILDRLVGYQISPLLWDKVRRGLSAGRVQSVAVRMVCEREQEINDFIEVEYWSITAALQQDGPPSFLAQLEQVDGRKLSNKKDSCIGDEVRARAIVAELQDCPFVVDKVSKKKTRRNPSPPFITSSLQIEANRKLRFSAKKTMMLAQRLYEGIAIGPDGPTGLITYMRTDSTRINDEALGQVRDYIAATYGGQFLPAKANIYRAKKSAQDAHEAIRPTDVTKTPESVAPFLEKDMLSLYTLVWKRFVACQMAPAIYDQTSVSIQAGRFGFKAVGSIIRFLGFMSLYVEAGDDNHGQQADPDKDVILPDLREGKAVELLQLEPKQHFTQPPPRYTEATLVKALEENGVGRPSTYAAILSTIQEKEYVQLEQRKFFPTDLGKLVNELLVRHFPAIMNTEFTASMEQNLDRVEEGAVAWLRILQEFYGPFRQALDLAKEEMKSVKRTAVPTDVKCKLCGGVMVIKWGRNGEFLACENYPACKNTQDFTKDEAGHILPLEKEELVASGETCEKCGQPLVYKNGRYGRFLACSGYPKCKHIQAEKSGVHCPQQGCGGELIKKISKKGKVFYSCSNYPKCTFAIWDKPINRPCPDCHSPYLLEKENKKQGLHVKCPNEQCGYLQKITNEEEQE